jgi:hypothetical protein
MVCRSPGIRTATVRERAFLDSHIDYQAVAKEAVAKQHHYRQGAAILDKLVKE